MAIFSFEHLKNGCDLLEVKGDANCDAGIKISYFLMHTTQEEQQLLRELDKHQNEPLK